MYFPLPIQLKENPGSVAGPTTEMSMRWDTEGGGGGGGGGGGDIAPLPGSCLVVTSYQKAEGHAIPCHYQANIVRQQEVVSLYNSRYQYL